MKTAGKTASNDIGFMKKVGTKKAAPERKPSDMGSITVTQPRNATQKPHPSQK